VISAPPRGLFVVFSIPLIPPEIGSPPAGQFARTSAFKSALSGAFFASPPQWPDLRRLWLLFLNIELRALQEVDASFSVFLFDSFSSVCAVNPCTSPEARLPAIRRVVNFFSGSLLVCCRPCPCRLPAISLLRFSLPLAERTFDFPYSLSRVRPGRGCLSRIATPNPRRNFQAFGLRPRHHPDATRARQAIL